jgi:hypothetical protein
MPWSPVEASSWPVVLSTLVGDLVMTVARTGRSSGFEHQDRSTSRRRPMLYSSRNDEDVAAMQVDGPCAAVGISKANVEVAVQNEEELVGVVVDMPDMLALHFGDSYVVVIDSRDDARAPHTRRTTRVRHRG